jgi:hypothetical protein
MKRKLTAAEEAARELRRQQFQTVFVGGKMKRVRRPPMIDGLSLEEFLAGNADPLWLHQNGLWDLLPPEPVDEPEALSHGPGDREDDPF